MSDYQIEFINNTDTEPVTEQLWTLVNVFNDQPVTPEQPYISSHALDNPLYNIKVEVMANEAHGVLMNEGEIWVLDCPSDKITLNTSVDGKLTFTSTIANNLTAHK